MSGSVSTSTGALIAAAVESGETPTISISPLGDIFGSIPDGIEGLGSTDIGIHNILNGNNNKNEQGDLVTTSLSFLLVHLKIDGTAWAPFLSSVFVGSMALLQVNSIHFYFMFHFNL